MSKKKPLPKVAQPYPTSPLVSSAKVVFIGGINSTGQKGWSLSHDGYNVAVPKMPSRNWTAITAAMLPCCKGITGIGGYLTELRNICLNCTKQVPDIVVGVSQGGAVAMSLVQNEWKGARLLLVAPAWKTFGVEPIVPANTVILHGKHDWVIGMGDSVRLAKNNKAKLVCVNDSHHLGKSYDLILREVDKISKGMGKHKPESIIRKEWAEYHAACKAWRDNCTKMFVPINLTHLESVDGKLW